MQLVWPKSLRELIVVETNRYAQQNNHPMWVYGYSWGLLVSQSTLIASSVMKLCCKARQTTFSTSKLLKVHTGGQ